MRKVAIFGNAGGGKSRLAKRLAAISGLPAFSLDQIQYRPGGAEVAHDEYLEVHAELLKRPAWIIDGFGCVASAWVRFAEADTLIYIDLPLRTHAWWVTKRGLKGLFRNPDGWPDRSPVFRSTLNSYKVLRLCHRKLTPAYRQLVAESAQVKRVYHLRSGADIENFLRGVRNQMAPGDA